MTRISTLVFVFSFLFSLLKYSNENESNDWWKYTIIYEVYIRSFKDSNGDGVGDLNGITSKLDHFVELGIQTLWLTPFFTSPMNDMGYDISNFTEVDSVFGTMEDFDNLVTEMKKRDLKLIMDFVINHSSDEHPWFLQSIKEKKPYSEYYIWKNPKGYDRRGSPIPPNNWVSRFEGSAWKWNDERKQFYLHQFAEKQPEFNLRNPQLTDEIKKIMKFWFKRGINGLRMDATRHFFEDEHFRDEPVNNGCENKTALTWFDYDHIYTVDQWGSYEFIHELREFWDNLQSNKDEEDERILIAEAYTDMNNTMLYYDQKNYKVTHFPFNFEFVNLESFPNTTSFDRSVKSWLDNMPSEGVANWVAENHDRYRVSDRFNEEFADILVITVMTLPGIACIYYGQEIGMKNTRLRFDQMQDKNRDELIPLGRDVERCPMQWDDSENAGFTSKFKPWLPVNTNYYRVNVERQKKQKRSRYNMFKILSNLRKTHAAKFGDFKSFVISPWVYAYTRSAPGKPMYIVILNLGTETEIVNIRSVVLNLPPKLKVVTSSLNSGYTDGSKILRNRRFPRSLVMRPLSSIVLSA